MEINIVLTCINNFQDYILINIKQLLLLNHEHIYIITNRSFFNKFVEYNNKINLIAVEDIEDTYHFMQLSKMDKQFRGGFCALTSARFFYIYDFMRQYDVEHVIHIENDVLLYYNCDELKDKLNPRFVYLPFDSFRRNVASIMYIPNHSIFKSALDCYDINRFDMENFSEIRRQTQLIRNFPIFIDDLNEGMEYQFVTKNHDEFQFIFDAAAIGQYLGGVDPQNASGDTSGFVNETCIIKYNNYKFVWNLVAGMRKPFIQVDGILHPIFNLHIHCKNLGKFI
jgi:hypothetical protein